MYMVGQKSEATNSWQQFCQILTDLHFFIERFLGKFAVNCLLEIPPLLAYLTTLPSEIIIVRKQAINDKLQGSVATYLRCGGVVNNQSSKGYFGY